MRRRTFLQIAGGAAMARSMPAFAQQSAKLPLVAVITPAAEALAAARAAQLRDGLRQAGLVEGKEYVLTLRFANGDNARLSELIKELEPQNPRVWVCVGGGVIALHQQLPSAPAVFTGIAVDPVRMGWADSYAKPGGMMTGNVQNAVGGLESLTPKIGFLKELVPNLTQLGYIGLNDSLPFERDAMQRAAKQFGFALLMHEVATLDEIESAIASGQAEDVSAFYISGDPRLLTRIPQIVAAFAKTGKPAIGPYPLWTRSGLLMSYYTDAEDQARRAGGYVAKILRGAKPGDLPIEQADKFTLIINLRTAKRLGVAVPPTLLAQADEVID